MYPPLWARLLRLYGQRFPILRGKAHLVRWAYHRLPKLIRPVDAPINGDIWMELWPWLWADFCTYVMDSPEAYHLHYFKSRISRRSVVFDIGAYIGVYSLGAGRIAVEGEVHAFEPDPRSAGRLARAIEVNGLKNVHLSQCAVADEKAELILVLQEYPPMSSIKCSPPSQGVLQENLETIPVSVCTVDEYCTANDISNIDFMKIDVEGAELLMLKGAFNTITAFRPELMVELHERQSQNFGYSIQDTISHLQVLKYELLDVTFGLTKPHLTPFNYDIDSHQSRHIVIALPV
jgi:FkbM family methyltransferase